MKILIIGFLALYGWGVLSTHIYVCNIKGLCDDPAARQISVISEKDIVAEDTSRQPLVVKHAMIPENIVTYFGFDKSDFISDTRTDKYFNESNTFLNQNSQSMLLITGYTDSVGSDDYNQALGFRRAQSMKHYFESKGGLVNRILLESKGEKEPADNNNTAAGRSNNRRTVITIKN